MGVAVVVNSVVNMVVKVGVKMVVEKVVSMAWAPWRPGLSGRWPAHGAPAGLPLGATYDHPGEEEDQEEEEEEKLVD